MEKVHVFIFVTVIALLMGCGKSDITGGTFDNGNDQNTDPPPTDIQSNLECIDGSAGDEYSCQNVDLLSRLTPEQLLGTRLNDIWGWTDPQTGTEYALVGLTDGVAFVDISDPAFPLVVGKLREATYGMAKETQFDIQGCGLNVMQAAGFSGEGSAWRDLKVYQDHLFVVSDAQDHGMQVFDLTRLRDVADPPQYFTEDTNYDQIDNSHNIVINEETGFAYTVGVTNGNQCAEGGLHMIDITSPLSPQFAGCFVEKEVQAVSTPGYIHDAQCVVYDGPDSDYAGREVCFSAGETALVIADVTEKSNPSTISYKGYSGASYAHQGWLTEDKNYFLLNDELDESSNASNTRTYIWDVSDLDDPQLIGHHEFETTSIDHNLYIRGEHVFESNYTSGLRILNASDISNANLQEVAWFDTYPNHDARMFDGAWSNYPFFESGVVIVSDISKGLFVLKPDLE